MFISDKWENFRYGGWKKLTGQQRVRNGRYSTPFFHLFMRFSSRLPPTHTASTHANISEIDSSKANERGRIFYPRRTNEQRCRKSTDDTQKNCHIWKSMYFYAFATQGIEREREKIRNELRSFSSVAGGFGAKCLSAWKGINVLPPQKSHFHRFLGTCPGLSMETGFFFFVLRDRVD